MKRTTLVIALISIIFTAKAQNSAANTSSEIASYNKLRIALYGGQSYQLATANLDIPADLNDYFFEMKSGQNIGGQIDYFFKESLGYGMTFQSFITSNKMEISEQENISDIVNISFIGPSFTARGLAYNKVSSFYTTVSVGYLSYVNSKNREESFEIYGHALGYSLGLGFDIGINNKLAIGLKSNLIIGKVNDFKNDNGLSVNMLYAEDGEYSSLKQVNFSLVLSYSN